MLDDGWCWGEDSSQLSWGEEGQLMDKVGWEQGELQVLGMEDILTSRNNCSKCSSETFLRISFFRIMPY